MPGLVGGTALARGAKGPSGRIGAHVSGSELGQSSRAEPVGDIARLHLQKPFLSLDSFDLGRCQVVDSDQGPALHVPRSVRRFQTGSATSRETVSIAISSTQ